MGWGRRADVGAARLLAGDFDNNGALDLLASTRSDRADVAGGGRPGSRRWPAAVSGSVAGAQDLTGDGTLDLFGIAGGRATRWVGKGSRGYHWKAIRVQAQQNAGDQRINSFGLGGEIEVRSGLLWQKQPIAGPLLHFGLGEARAIDVARVVWPNGIPQAEFEPALDSPLVAEQRLKGSCPWVFAHDGREVRFVTDFLWRSPLGLRINAQDTAGVVQTEDWVRIGGDQLAPVDGAYDVRITAELWETHFFDHVSLLVVDHEPGTEVFVDERFSAARPPALDVHTVRGPASRVPGARRRGAGRHVAGGGARWPVGGGVRERAVSGHRPRALRRVRLAGGRLRRARCWWRRAGCIPPTAASTWRLPRAARCGRADVALEAQVGRPLARLDPDIGFPAGKNKTMLVDLQAARGRGTPAAAHESRDLLGPARDRANASASGPRTQRLAASSAELRYRGFSATTSPRGDQPETPVYAPIASVSQRWRDLEGYYTRFGDVQPLVDRVDDRYVIMNAGDELRLRFPEQPAPPDGWRRDFVLIGDGWEKDGDYNTGHSQTVLPLPEHAKPDYGVGAGAARGRGRPSLQASPRRLAIEFHTRYVTPGAFLRGARLGP